jgi:phosphoribosylformylglycinamidine synthase
MVRTNTIGVPGLGAGVVRIKGTDRALAMSVDGNGRHCYLDPYLGAMLAVAEASRNVACAGARPLAATNCLNFGNPERPAIMWQFAKAVEGIGAACRALDVPITGGNVSVQRDRRQGDHSHARDRRRGPLEHATGGLAQVKMAATSCSAKDAASSAAAILKTLYDVVAGTPPALDFAERALQGLVVELAGERLMRSAHGV